mmetsp:Transcript_8610/g.19491  ORF Transcript_8610/g.19491 Transcript_8610/m.19491 type:complete len:82 (-) Transcript_8610:1472-1717(-)
MRSTGGYTAPEANNLESTESAKASAALRNISGVTSAALLTMVPSAIAGKINALLANPGANVTPGLYSTGAKRVPLAKIARP